MTEQAPAGVRLARLPDLQTVQSYLRTAGWTLASADARTLLWRLQIPNQDLRVVLPASEGMTDYGELFISALRVLAYVERRSPDEIAGDMTYGASDTVSVRLTPDAPEGQAPLAMAHTSLSALRNYIVGSGAALDNHALVLPANRPRRAEAFANETRVMARAGSFILALALPLFAYVPSPALVEDDANDEESGVDLAGDVGYGVQETLLDVPIQPFGRRVISRMIAAAKHAQHLADEVGSGNQPIRAFGRPEPDAANATELEALSALGGSRDEPYQVRFAHSPLGGAVTETTVLRVTPSQQRIMSDGAHFLRTMQSRSNVTIEGRVIKLARDPKSGPGEVVVRGIIDDSGEERNVRADLTSDDYDEALSAHKSGLRVIVRGDLEVRGNYKYIRPLRAFAIIPGLTDDEDS